MKRNGLWGLTLIVAFAAVAWADPGDDQAKRGFHDESYAYQPQPGGWQGGGPGGGWQSGWQDDYSPGYYFPDQYDMPAASWGGDVVDVSYFYRELAPYGGWVLIPQYGWCWTPYGVTPSWRPYTRGHWAYSDCGWTWVSYEPWGWATYHYGRWFFDPWHGWVWVPGTVWAPSWCAFREGRGVIGWAPLPPQANWRPGFGLNININIVNSSAFRRFGWNFVDMRNFIQPNVMNYVYQPHRGVNFFDQTQDATNIVMGNNNTIINNSINIKRVESATRRPVPMLRLADRNRASDVFNSRFNGRELSIFRPKFAERAPRMTPDKMFGGNKPETGTWSERLSKEQQQLQQRLQDERSRMQQRQNQMRQNTPEYVPQNGLDRWIRREQDAFGEREQREKNLVDRERERLQQNKTGFTQSKLPKYMVEQPAPRKVLPAQPGTGKLKESGGLQDTGGQGSTGKK